MYVDLHTPIGSRCIHRVHGLAVGLVNRCVQLKLSQASFDCWI